MSDDLLLTGESGEAPGPSFDLDYIRDNQSDFIWVGPSYHRIILFSADGNDFDGNALNWTLGDGELRSGVDGGLWTGGKGTPISYHSSNTTLCPSGQHMSWLAYWASRSSRQTNYQGFISNSGRDFGMATYTDNASYYMYMNGNHCGRNYRTIGGSQPLGQDVCTWDQTVSDATKRISRWKDGAGGAANSNPTYSSMTMVINRFGGQGDTVNIPVRMAALIGFPVTLDAQQIFNLWDDFTSHFQHV